MDLHEAGLQPDLEGDKRARMVAECRLEMSVRMLRRLLGSELRRLAEPGQRRANGALGLAKAFPDPVGRGLAQAAVEFAEGLPFVAGGNAVDEKRPQAFGGQEQPCDLVGPPDAESSAAAAGSISVAAKDPLRSHGLPPRMLIVIAAEKPMSNQPADLFAVRTRRQLQLRMHLLEFRLSLANSHAPARIQIPGYGGDSRKSNASGDRKNRGRGTMSPTSEASLRAEAGLRAANRPDCRSNKNVELRRQFGHNQHQSAIRPRPVTSRPRAATARQNLLMAVGVIPKEPERLYTETISMRPDDLKPDSKEPNKSRDEAIGKLIKAMQGSQQV